MNLFNGYTHWSVDLKSKKSSLIRASRILESFEESQTPEGKYRKCEHAQLSIISYDLQIEKRFPKFQKPRSKLVFSIFLRRHVQQTDATSERIANSFERKKKKRSFCKKKKIHTIAKKLCSIGGVWCRGGHVQGNFD